MALLTVPRARGRHAAKTPLWRQIGIGRARHNVTAARLVSPPSPEPAVAKVAAPTLVVSADQARDVVERLFPASADGLYPLEWRYGAGWASAQVDPGLVPEAARNVVLAYAAFMGAGFVQETVDDRLHMRVSRSVDGVQVTVWADTTPEQQQLALPAAEPPADPVLPIEEGVRRCVLDETQTFAPITDDMDDPREHPDADPDGDRPAPTPTETDPPSNPDPEDTAGEPTEEQPADDNDVPSGEDEPATSDDAEEAA